MTPVRRGQAAIGLTLAGLVIAAWLAIHVYGVFFHRWTTAGIAVAPLLVAVQTWLSVGLFIIAHDCIHGSLAPGWPRLHRALGQFCVGIYAGFSFRRLATAHWAHHTAPGTADDPDFDPDGPRRFLPWFHRFFTTYFGWRELAVLALWLGTDIFLLGAAPLNLAIFWGLPALLSALQLFFFGTWLPHRHEDEAFADEHRARSSGYGRLASLLSCYHFGYHHEHHAHPDLPWWRLPEALPEAAGGERARQA
jgi:beta-carotene ketolase (CrtW type)